MNGAAAVLGNLASEYGIGFVLLLTAAAAAWLLTRFFLNFLQLLNQREKDMQDVLNDRQRIHQDAIEVTFQMYQAQLAENRIELELARERIAALESQVRELKSELKAASKRRDDPRE